MSRPLLITDCDEVLLHMVTHFAEWLEADHGVHFFPRGGSYENAMRRIADDYVLSPDEMWVLLDGFFREHMGRQTLVPGAAEALGEIGEFADIVVLTNIRDHLHGLRVAQLDALGIRHRVVCNQGGKGVPANALLAEYRPSATVFVDDLPYHHESLAEHAPGIWRLHMIAEPEVAKDVPPAFHAHARIDDWHAAKGWVIERLKGGRAAD
jgi:hypothetical protein